MAQPGKTSEAAQGLSARVARHVAEARFEALPAATVAATKRALLDAVGVMLAASGEAPEVRPFLDFALAEGGAGESTVLGVGARAPASWAAFANGAMAHALDYEDAFDPAPSHPNASLIPAVLALAEARGPVSGRELITAIAVGCDLVCRMGLSLRRPMEDGGWYPPPILGAYGAAAGAARVLRLAPDQVLDALSLALCQATCSGEIKYDRDTVVRAVREAFPAQAAVTAAELARRGVKGFAAPLEGRAGFFALYAGGDYDPSAILDGLGERFWIERLSFKPWPCCRGTHPFVEAALALRERHGFGWRDVAGAVAEGGEVQRMLAEPEASKRAPATAIDAKFSIPFTLATALVHGQVTLESFSPEALTDPDVLEVAALCRFAPREDWGRDRAASGRLSLTLRSGVRFTEDVDVALGDPDRPMSEAALREKFLDCAGRAAAPPERAEAERLADAILALEHLDDVSALFLPAKKKALA